MNIFMWFVIGLSFTMSVQANINVKIVTNKGDIELELNDQKAPITVKNFLSYVDKKFYENTIFHRVIPNFMIQGGGFTQDLSEKPTNAPIKNEADNGLKNELGTIAMARTSVIDSATSQFFINVSDNSFLDHKDSSVNGYGYAVFGKVKKGFSVLNVIKSVPTQTKKSLENVPIDNIIIKSITVIN